MNGIVINIDPVIFRIADFEIRWYPVFIIVAVLAAIFISLRESVKRGMTQEQVLYLSPWVIFSGVIGARLVHVIDRWENYSSNLSSIFALQQGGLAIWGAVAGGMIAAVIYSKINQINIGKLFDVLVPGLLTAQIIGRVGCIINGDAYGDPTTLPWGFNYIHPGAMIPVYLKGIPTHPYPVYEMIWNSITLFLLLALRKKIRTNGTVFAIYIISYSVGRFLLTFVRQEKVWFLGLQEAQLISILGVAVALIILLILRRRSVAV